MKEPVITINGVEFSEAQARIFLDSTVREERPSIAHEDAVRSVMVRTRCGDMLARMCLMGCSWIVDDAVKRVLEITKRIAMETASALEAKQGAQSLSGALDKAAADLSRQQFGVADLDQLETREQYQERVAHGPARPLNEAPVGLPVHSSYEEAASELSKEMGFSRQHCMNVLLECRGSISGARRNLQREKEKAAIRDVEPKAGIVKETEASKVNRVALAIGCSGIRALGALHQTGGNVESAIDLLRLGEPKARAVETEEAKAERVALSAPCSYSEAVLALSQGNGDVRTAVALARNQAR